MVLTHNRVSSSAYKIPEKGKTQREPTMNVMEKDRQGWKEPAERDRQQKLVCSPHALSSLLAEVKLQINYFTI